MRNAFIASLSEIAAHNPNVWLLCGDLGFSVLEPFAAKFPDRYINVGVAEQNMASIAAGIALSGKTVFTYSIGNFSTLRCLEQLRNDVCYHGADVKVVAVGAGYAYGSQGYTHHALEDVAIMSTLPAIEVFVPCDPVEVGAITHAIAASGKPSYLRLCRAGEPILHPGALEDVRRPRVLRDGREAVVLASGPVAAQCLEAAARLSQQGHDVGVVSVPCLKPFDDEFIRTAARRTSLMVTVEEHVLRGGLFSAVATALAGKPHQTRVIGIGVSELAGKTSIAGSREALLKAAGLAADALAHRIDQALAKAAV